LPSAVDNGRHGAGKGRRRPQAILRPAFSVARSDYRALWGYRELFGVLVWRLIIVRYKETAIGIAWAMLQPIGLMLVLVIFFGVFTRIPSNGVPYPLFVYPGLLVWQFCSQAFNQGSMAIVSNGQLVTRVYFPRSLLPAAVVSASLVDLLFAIPTLLALMLYYGVWPSIGGLVFVPMLIVTVLLSLGLALLFSCLNVFYRDVIYVLPFLTQIWMFSSPIIYPLSLIPERWQPLYALNPLVAVVETARWGFAGGPAVPVAHLATAAAVSFAVLGFGLRHFRRREAIFSDII
jgi:lipopolysaccharide transport system permease protein